VQLFITCKDELRSVCKLGKKEASLGTNGAAATVELGQPSGTAFTSNTANNGGISSSTLNSPQGIAFDSGNLWIADSFNNRVLEYTFTFTSGESASLVLGQSGFTTNTQATSQDGLHLRFVTFDGLAFDLSSNLWIADETNSRTLQFLESAISPSVPEFPAGGMALLLVVSAVAYAVIRYRIVTPSNRV
jgi:secreted PhoX family phosphatase